ncbi:MAG: TIGR02530 family flagellar biosynthesis protein [Limnochordia bacterium]|jgi:flagellar operon protein
MVDKIGGRVYLPVEPISKPKPQKTPTPKGDFQAILADKVREIKFSAHAQARLQSRGIQLTDTQREQLERAVDKAAAKGARESLVLLDDVAFVVSIKNRTVITAMVNPQQEVSVFTNIDSAVIT